MSDYIKREDAMKPLYERFSSAKSRDDDGIAEIVGMDYIAVSNVPSADVVEVRHGHWLDRTQEPGWPVAECSVCGSHSGMFWMNYCPNCGARMDGKEQE